MLVVLVAQLLRTVLVLVAARVAVVLLLRQVVLEAVTVVRAVMELMPIFYLELLVVHMEAVWHLELMAAVEAVAH